MRPSVSPETEDLHECVDCGARVSDPDGRRCGDCGNELVNLSRSRDL